MSLECRQKEKVGQARKTVLFTSFFATRRTNRENAFRQLSEQKHGPRKLYIFALLPTILSSFSTYIFR